MINTQEYINEKFPTQESRRGVIKLRIGGFTSYWQEGEYKRKGWTVLTEHLEGELDLNTFSNLEELIIVGTPDSTRPGYDKPQGITELKINECQKLKEVYLENGKLESLDFKNNTQLNQLRIHEQKQLTSLKGLGRELTMLTIAKCRQLNKVNIANCPYLMDLHLVDCDLTTSPLRKIFKQKQELKTKISNLILPMKDVIQREITLIKQTLSHDQ